MLTDTDTFAETRVGPPEPPVHYACGLCYPEPHPGMKAICGAELLGIESYGLMCVPCEKEAMRHALNHAVNMRY